VDLSEIVKEFAGAAKTDPNLLVGFETGDDAGVYRLTDDLALVQTVDYITPVVDDPFLFGQVAAANSISDVYAMGGRPLTAMNCCNFPAKNIDKASLRRILEGGFSKIKEAGATLVGGHTVRDDELKYGLSVTGLIDPRRILTNAAARPGDHVDGLAGDQVGERAQQPVLEVGRLLGQHGHRIGRGRLSALRRGFGCACGRIRHHGSALSTRRFRPGYQG